MKHQNFLLVVFQIALTFIVLSCRSNETADEIYANVLVNPNESKISFYWRDDQENIFRSIENLKKDVEKKGRKLRFAMNGGMYMEDLRPLGLFVQDGKTLAPLNTRKSAEGNFYLQPNGVFYIRNDKQALIVPTAEFKDDGQIKYATQSGPMLLVEGRINNEFKKDSDNLNIRNGVCVTADERVIFAISRREVNFYDFAEHFKNLGCRNALFLDGFVSRMYAPEQNIAQTGGDFGVIIGITE